MTRPPFINPPVDRRYREGLSGANTLPPALLGHHFSPPVDRRKNKNPEKRKKAHAATISTRLWISGQQKEPGAACAPGLPIPYTRSYQLARASPRTQTNCGSRDQRCVATPSAASHKRGRLLTPSAHRANELQTHQKSASTTNATRRGTRLASHKRGGF